MPLHSTTCPLDCPDACGVLAETGGDGGLVRLHGDPAHPYTRGFLCGKTSDYHRLVQHSARLTEPLLRRNGELCACSWDDALAEIARRVAPLRGEDVLPLCYAGNQGLVARRFPQRMMNALGAGAHNGGICSSVGEAGYRLVLGDLVGPDVEEIGEADALVLWGVDAARTWQHLLPTVKELCKAGVPVLAIDVYRTDTLKKLERWGGTGLVIHPGSDAALALGVARLAYERGWADRDFLARECLGAEAFEQHVCTAHDLEATCRATGLERAQVEGLAALLGRAGRAHVKTGTGWTRRRNGGASMRAVCSLAAVVGCAERVLFESADHFALDKSVLERPDLRGDRPLPQPSMQAALGKELGEGRYRAAFVWGHNPAVTLPDSARVRAGLSREDLFLVVHDSFLTETAALADVVLPATHFLEQSDLYASYGHRYLHYARKVVEPPAGAKSNLQAFAAMARALGLPRETWDVTEESVVEEVLEASRERIGDEDLQRLLAGERVKLRPLKRTGRGTPSGKIELVSEQAAQLGAPAMASWIADQGSQKGEFWLCPAPSKATHNSTFVPSERHMRLAGEPCCWIRPSDARAKGIAEGDRVHLENERGRLTLPARLSDEMPPGMLRIDGMPRPADTEVGYGVNLLTGPEISDLGGGATFFSTRVDLRRA
jgi:anaerobic selenocysteine-containing dehydrogenase